LADGLAAVEGFAQDSLSAVLAAVGVSPLPPDAPARRTAPLDIAIPVFNNAPLLRICLDSLLPTLVEGDSMWLIDDASTEPEISVLLADFRRRWSDTNLLVNPHNRGFVTTANRAFAATRRDVVLLNSDTEVAAGWLEHLQACLRRNPRAGIVCPISDRATILSVLPQADHKARTSIAAAAAATSVGDVLLPTAVGFCMLIRRELIEEVGVFSQAFAPGYGEENDLSMRALKAGWDIVACDQACVYHHSGGSFGREQSKALQASHQAKLDRLWPEYGPLVQSWWRDNPLRVKTEHLAWQGDERTGVVHVLHRHSHVGGTERVARTLIKELGDRYRNVLLYPGTTSGAWCDFELRSDEPCRELMLNARWIKPRTLISGNGADLSCPQTERAFARVVRGSGARIVHFHHLLHWDSLLLPALARELGCRVVISVHDFWFNCPQYNQLEYATGQPCGRSHAQADERCSKCLVGHSSRGLESRNDEQGVAVYTSGRHALIQVMLGAADAVLAPSEFIRQKLLTAYPSLSAGQLRVAPHGVPAPRLPSAPGQAAARVLAFFGGDQVLKGARLVLDIARSMRESAVTFRIHGRIKGFERASLPSNVELCGFYNPDDVSRAMEGVDLVLLPSYYEESFSMVASESWAHGIPVLGSTRGALAERVVQGVNGWLVPDMATGSWVNSLREILQGDAIERCREQLFRHSVTSIEQSSEALHLLYQDLLEQPALSVVPAPPAGPAARFRGKLEALRAGPQSPGKRSRARHCLGILRDHWGTAHYRVRFPLEELARSGGCALAGFHVVRKAGFDVARALRENAARHVVVQPYLSDEGLGMMEYLHREGGLHVTLVVDDLWTNLATDNPVRALMPDDVHRRLRHAASLSQSLVLTTHELARRLGLGHDNTHVINNALPDWVWRSLPAPSTRQQSRLRIGWAGAPQHAGDLAFLVQVMQDTADLADWVFLGMCPDALRPYAREVHDMVSFDRYPAALSAAGLDLAIAPLTDNAFNRCKSHLKVLEYGILGLPVIAADLEPYRHCPVPLAAVDDAEDWVFKIRSLLENAAERRERGRALRQWVLDNHMQEHRLSEWETALGMGDIAD
jgi:GT2 family glycosyltransferase/glycosyltransferase involved in cell wall biosynthesis